MEKGGEAMFKFVKYAWKLLFGNSKGAYEFGTCNAPSISGEPTGITDSASKEQRGTVTDLTNCDGDIVEMRLHGIKITTRKTIVVESGATIPTLSAGAGTSLLTGVTERWSKGGYKVVELEQQEVPSAGG